MLPIHIPQIELFDENTNEFFTVGPYHLLLEHSLKSMAKWEAKTHRPFSASEFTSEDLLEYIKCMTTNQVKDPTVYSYLRPKDITAVLEYMKDPMSAKRFRERKQKPGARRTMTVEDFYAAMVHFGIPFECENWHFNRLVALIRACEGTGDSQMFRNYREKQQFYRELNESRRKALGTKG